ncbi:MAG TPA: amidohydrolase family protein [Stellaceae bacterium]|nr:amidohydrolase family protein [Stellaceae bacterium]
MLEPELPIIDTHQHLWQRGDWTYLLPELLADLNTGHNIVATVFEECRSMYRAGGPEEMRPVGEVEFVAGVAAMSASGGYGPINVAQGIIAYADLALGERVEPVLEALTRAGGGRIKGVRYSVGYNADTAIGNSRPDSAVHMYALPEVRAGVARLAAHGLVLDTWCYHPQLQDVVDLARAVPQATICMCHVGGVLGYGTYAGRKDEIHATWRASMAELAKCPNVFVKIGGMLNRGAAVDFRPLPAPPSSETWAAAWRPYVEPCIELFGAERCNFESNFPVDKMGTGYATLWNAFKRITAGCSSEEKAALYSGTARRLYKLN